MLQYIKLVYLRVTFGDNHFTQLQRFTCVSSVILWYECKLQIKE